MCAIPNAGLLRLLSLLRPFGPALRILLCTLASALAEAVGGIAPPSLSLLMAETAEAAKPRTTNQAALNRARRSSSFRTSNARNIDDVSQLLTGLQVKPYGKEEHASPPSVQPAAKPEPAAAALPPAEKASTAAFATGARVMVKRSNGEESLAFVTEVENEAKGIYIVALEAIDSNKYKKAKADMLRAAPAEQKFASGTKVMVMRSNGKESACWVREFSTRSGRYNVELDTENSGLFKNVYERDLRLEAEPVAVEDPADFAAEPEFDDSCI